MLEDTGQEFTSILFDVPESSLLVDSGKFSCSNCGGEITWYCERDMQDDPRVPPPCGCTDGHCACDRFICVKCGMIVDSQKFGQRRSIVKDGGRIVVK